MDEGIDEAPDSATPMNVGIVTPFLTPTAGGSATSTYLLARSLQRRGDHVTVFTSDWGRKEAKFEGEELLSIEESKCKLDTLGFLYTPGMRKRLEAYPGSFDIMDFNNFRTYQNVVASKFAVTKRIPYVVRARGSMPRLGKAYFKWMFDNIYGNKILNNSSKVIALTRVESEQYRDFGVQPQNIAMIPNGVDLSSFDNLPAKGRFRSIYGIKERTIILYSGRIHKIKGLDTLIKSFALLRDGNRSLDTRLVLAGPDGGYLSEAVSLTKRLRIESDVLFCGPLNGEDKLAALVDANVVVLPSYYETFPNAILEAYACSRPVVASRVLAMDDLVLHGETGLLVEPRDACGLIKSDCIRPTESR